MSSGGGKGGKTTDTSSGTTTGATSSTVQVPTWLEDAARRNMARADEIAKIGYTPYYGPDVAGFTPMQQAAFQNTNDAAAAFGMSAPASAMAGMPQAQNFAGGVQGYSSAPLYENARAALQQNAPAQYGAISSMFYDPVTGAQPRSPFGSDAVAPSGTQSYRQSGGGGGMTSTRTSLPNVTVWNSLMGPNEYAAPLNFASIPNDRGSTMVNTSGGQFNGFGNAAGAINDRYDPYNDPSVVGFGSAAKNAISGTVDRASGMGGGK